jgi:hypothetical protein
MYASAQGVAANASRAFRLARVACDGGVAVACRYVGDAYDTARGTELATGRAIEFYDRACRGGDGLACVDAAMVRVETSRTTDHDEIPVYERFCREGIATACTRRGWIAERESQGSIAATWYLAACSRGDAIGCNNEGTLLSRWNSGAGYDLERAAEFYREACRRGSEASCRNVNIVLRLESSPPYDADSVAALYASCRDGTNTGCVELAQLAWHGVFIARDDTAGANLFDWTCQLGDARGCVGSAIASANGQGTEHNESQARTTAARACTGGDEEGCALAAVLAASGARH